MDKNEEIILTDAVLVISRDTKELNVSLLFLKMKNNKIIKVLFSSVLIREFQDPMEVFSCRQIKF